jgi:hypothetical protein
MSDEVPRKKGKGLICPICNNNTLGANNGKHVCSRCKVVAFDASKPLNPGKGKGLLCPRCKTNTLFPVSSQVTADVTTTTYNCNNDRCSWVVSISEMNIKIK